MPKKQTKKTAAKKNIQKRSRINLLKFLPALLLFALSGLLNFAPALSSAHGGRLLGYATSVSVNSLLSSTNDRRASAGAKSLTINNKLNSAAQAKANDMVKRDYWSHNTPDGDEPWVFFDRAGYKYKAAGENLAYGFATSADTVTGWMNSAPHKKNLLNTAFTEAGFGIANSADYVDSGEQTIVVALYGLPQTSTPNAAPIVAQPAAPSPAPTAAKPSPPKESQPIAVTKPKLKKSKTPSAKTKSSEQAAAIQTTAAPANVRKLQILTAGNAAWSSTLLVISICGLGALWAIHRGLHIRRFILAGEHFLVRHIHLDLTMLAIVVLGATLLQTTGIIR